MAYTVMAYVDTAYLVQAHIIVACIATAYVVMAYIVKKTVAWRAMGTLVYAHANLHARDACLYTCQRTHTQRMSVHLHTRATHVCTHGLYSYGYVVTAHVVMAY